jgi:hypothetical protein
MTRAQARKRLQEATAKVKAVYLWRFGNNMMEGVISTQDMAAIEKIINKCLKRLN